MNSGLLIKAVRETWLITVLCMAGLAIFEGLVAYFFWEYQSEVSDEVLNIPFVRNLIESLVGSELGEQFSMFALPSLAWAHPLVLALLWAHEITVNTRVPASEIDRGTADILLGLPVSRTRIYLTETVVWLGSGTLLIAAAIAGNWFGHEFIPPSDRPAFGRKLIAAANLFAVYVSVGGLTLLISALSDRRGRAIGVAFGFVLVHFLWNFLGAYWGFADDTAWLSYLNYHRPMAVLEEGVFPARDIGILVVLGVAPWAAGWAVFVRRDVCTV